MEKSKFRPGIGDPRDSIGWDRQLEGGLPDCRLRGYNKERNDYYYAGQLWDRLFCANCGAKGGIVAKGSPHVFYICDPCAIKFDNKPPPGTIEVKPDGINAKVVTEEELQRQAYLE